MRAVTATVEKTNIFAMPSNLMKKPGSVRPKKAAPLRIQSYSREKESNHWSRPEKILECSKKLTV